MKASDRRQSARIKRHAKEAERQIFTLIEQMSEFDYHPSDYWIEALSLIASAQIELDLCRDYAINSQREVNHVN
jgi:hypothetical protein